MKEEIKEMEDKKTQIKQEVKRSCIVTFSPDCLQLHVCRSN